MASTAASARPSATSKATYTQSSPVAAKAALRIWGEREWRIGSPITAATRVAPVGGSSPSGSHPPNNPSALALAVARWKSL